MADPVYFCPAGDCRHALADTELLCPDHWRQLPFKVQWRIFEAVAAKDLRAVRELYQLAIEICEKQPAPLTPAMRLNSPLG